MPAKGRFKGLNIGDKIIVKDTDGIFEAEVRYFNDIGEPYIKPDDVDKHRLRYLSTQEFEKVK